ncbi:MAG TPA: glycosidase, partial [Phycisphaerae bacterium]|nr:glycosidase [Phycisphaerae bacterium]
RFGLVLMDLENPLKILKRTDRPILEPAADWELKGDVNNAVFTCGTVLLGNDLWVYYGGADTVIGLARGNVSEFLNV